MTLYRVAAFFALLACVCICVGDLIPDDTPGLFYVFASGQVGSGSSGFLDLDIKGEDLSMVFQQSLSAEAQICEIVTQ